MKNTGTLRIQTFAARQSAPVEGVTVAVQGDGFTLHCITDATGSAADIPVEAPACTLSLDEDNTIRPYAVVSLTAAKSGYRTVRIEGIQIFAGQVTLAQPQMLPDTEEGRDIPNAPIIIPPHALFAGSGMTMGAFGMSRSSSVTGSICGCASVTCPAKIWMPSMRTVR